jgi:hypothetical protein
MRVVEPAAVADRVARTAEDALAGYDESLVTT